jgi:transcriptional regulator with GAF, ATPase, and Fis domain
VDARVLAATNRDLEEEVRQGRFREDLYYRLNVVTLRIPPLRERREDIPLLIAHMLRWPRNAKIRATTISAEALTLLERYDWPGNVRELETRLNTPPSTRAGR